MIKKLVLEVLRVGMVLFIGQMPFGDSTVGGTFVSSLKTGFGKALAFYNGSVVPSSKEIKRQVTSEKKLDLEKIKKTILPEDRLED